MRCELDRYIYKSNQSSQARDKLSSMTCQETCVDYLYDFLQDREASVYMPLSPSHSEWPGTRFGLLVM